MINSKGWLRRRGEGIQDQFVTTNLDTPAQRRDSDDYREGYAEARRAFLIGQAVRERRLALGLSQVESLRPRGHDPARPLPPGSRRGRAHDPAAGTDQRSPRRRPHRANRTPRRLTPSAAGHRAPSAVIGGRIEDVPKRGSLGRMQLGRPAAEMLPFQYMIWVLLRPLNSQPPGRIGGETITTPKRIPAGSRLVSQQGLWSLARLVQSRVCHYFVAKG